MSEISEIEKRTLSLTRTFDASIDLVWEAWSQSEHIVKWWGPPGMNTRVMKHDFQEGGEWKYVMTMPDGNDFIAEGVYSKIEFQALIESSANFRPMTEGVTIVAIFKENDKKTDFTFKVIHPTEEYCKQQEEMGFMNGWGSVFDRLKNMLETED